MARSSVSRSFFSVIQRLFSLRDGRLVQFVEKLRMFPPPFAHLDEEFEKDLPVEKFFDLEPRLRADLLQHASLLADDDPFVPGTLDMNRRHDAGQREAIFLGRFFPFVDNYGDGVWNLFMRQ